VQKQNVSPLYMRAADALCRARRLPVGPDRNELRQRAIGLRWLEKNGFSSKVENRLGAMLPEDREDGRQMP
jgi:hypothetical protein